MLSEKQIEHLNKVLPLEESKRKEKKWRAKKENKRWCYKIIAI